MPTLRSLPSFVVSAVLLLWAAPASAQFAALYRDTQFGGTQVVVNGDMPRLSTQSFNDQASSIKIYTDQPIAVYKDTNYSGSCRTIWAHVPRLSDTGFGNDNISSVRVAWTCEGGAYNPDACAAAGCGAFSTCTDQPRPAPNGAGGRTCSPPTRVNIAPQGVARQSSTGWDGAAPRAIDGNLDGRWGAASVAHTAGEPNAWYEIDLKIPRRIDTVAVANRTDCCGERMVGAIIELSALACDATPRVAVATSTPLANTPLETRTFAGAPLARYVCLRQPGQYLQLAEVQVFEATELDACATSPCVAGATCTDLPGTDTTAAGRTCALDACRTAPCNAGATCTDLPGVDATTAGRTCELDACARVPCGANASCRDLTGDDATAAGRTCTCLTGFVGDADAGCQRADTSIALVPNRFVNLVIVYDAEAAALLGPDPVGALDGAVSMASAFLEGGASATDRTAVRLAGTSSWDRVVPSAMTWPKVGAQYDAVATLQAFRTWSQDQAARLDGLAAGNADAVVLVSGKDLSSPATAVVGSLCTDAARAIVRVPRSGARVNLAAALARALAMNLGAPPTLDDESLMSWWSANTPGSLARSPASGLGFAWLPAATFTMGSPANERGREGGEVQRATTLSRGAWIADTEVTRAAWRAVMGAPAPTGSCGDDACPVERVSYWDALTFANRLSSADGLPLCYALTGCSGTVGVDLACQGATVTAAGGDPLACTGYRLPTEAEWERAYRADTTTALYNGGLSMTACGDTNARAIGVHCDTQARPAKGLLANAAGLYDLAGNVAEWTWDRMGARTTQAVTDPLGATSGDARVTRGGGWSSEASALRAASRVGVAPGTRRDGLGLRVVIGTPSGFPQATFSALSKAHLANWLASEYPQRERCLDDEPPARATSARCGDGRIEGDEDCDPGIGVGDACCTSLCELAPGCACANTDACCTSGQLTPASAKKVCRAASDECDLADLCDGLSSACPVDAYASPGEGCRAGGRCYERQCVSGLALCTDTGGAYAVPSTGTPSERYCADVACQVGGSAQYTLPVPDGLACGADQMCSDGVCVAQGTLKRYRWKIGAWGACAGSARQRSVTCVDEAGASAADAACPASERPAATQTCVPAAPAPTSQLTVTSKRETSWPRGYCTGVTVENRSAAPIVWSVTQAITAPHGVSQVWGAKAWGTTGVVTFTGAAYNLVVQPQGKVQFGYCATR